jgi:hypothetical protein
LQFTGLDYPTATPYFTATGGAHTVRIEELLPTGSSPATRTIYDQSTSLTVNDESTLVVVGDAASGTEEVVDVRTVTRGVPTGKTRVQFIHATLGGAPVDVYVTAPDAAIAASTPFAAGLTYKSVTGQQDITGGNAQIVVTAAGSPATVLFDSGTVFLTLEGTVLIAIVQNNGADAAVRPFILSILTGTGSGVLLDENTQASLRLVNASPGTYSLDAFLNETTVADTDRQACDPGTVEAATLLELCTLAYGSIGTYASFLPGSYELKFQVAGNDAISAQSFAGGFALASESTVVPVGLVSDTATATQLSLVNLLAGRRIATAGQLRIVNASVAATDAISGDPTTDRIELYITAPGAVLADESPDFFSLAVGFDSGYVALPAGEYQVTLAKTDTAATDPVPEPLFTQQVSLDVSGLYTLVIGDSIGGIAPLQSFSLEDDPTPAP